MKEQEIRSFDIEFNSLPESRKVEGYALVFNTLSNDLGGFREQIDSNSLEGVIERSDVMAVLNHDKTRGILARCRYGNGTLTLTIDERGLKYSFEAPHTALGEETLEYLRRGDITQSSFAFTVESDTWEKQGDGSYIRTINQFGNLFDVSPVFSPAYNETSVSCKRFAEIQEEERLANEKRMAEEAAAEEAKKAEEEAAQKAHIAELHAKLVEEYKDYMK